MMDREDAIEYLKRKGVLGEHIKKTKKEIPTTKIKVEYEFEPEDEKTIRSVLREGKIFGDPLVELK